METKAICSGARNGRFDLERGRSKTNGLRGHPTGQLFLHRTRITYCGHGCCNFPLPLLHMWLAKTSSNPAQSISLIHPNPPSTSNHTPQSTLQSPSMRWPSTHTCNSSALPAAASSPPHATIQFSSMTCSPRPHGQITHSLIQ